MKLFTLTMLVSTLALTGCASTDADKSGDTISEQSYTPLGTLIAKKGPARGDTGKIDLQSFDNNRTMNNGANNAPSGR